MLSNFEKKKKKKGKKSPICCSQYKNPPCNFERFLTYIGVSLHHPTHLCTQNRFLFNFFFSLRRGSVGSNGRSWGGRRLDNTRNALKQRARHHLARFQLRGHNGIDRIGFANCLQNLHVVGKHIFAILGLSGNEIPHLLSKNPLHLGNYDICAYNSIMKHFNHAQDIFTILF